MAFNQYSWILNSSNHSSVVTLPRVAKFVHSSFPLPRSTQLHFSLSSHCSSCSNCSPFSHFLQVKKRFIDIFGLTHPLKLNSKVKKIVSSYQYIAMQCSVKILYNFLKHDHKINHVMGRVGR